jgi:hypothetical protein
MGKAVQSLEWRIFTIGFRFLVVILQSWVPSTQEVDAAVEAATGTVAIFFFTEVFRACRQDAYSGSPA